MSTPSGWYMTEDGDEVHVYGSPLSDEARAQIRALIAEFKREEAERLHASAEDAAQDEDSADEPPQGRSDPS